MPGAGLSISGRPSSLISMSVSNPMTALEIRPTNPNETMCESWACCKLEYSGKSRAIPASHARRHVGGCDSGASNVNDLLKEWAKRWAANGADKA